MADNSNVEEDYFKMCDVDITKNKEKIKKMILGIRRLKGEEKENQKKEIEHNLSKATRKLNQFSISLKDFSGDENIKQNYEKIRQNHEDDLNKLQQNLDMAVQQQEREELIEKEKEKPPEKKSEEKKKKKKDIPVEEIAIEKPPAIDPEMNKKINDELFGDIFGMAEESIQIVERMIRTAEETTQIADNSLEVLKKQEEQLNRASEQLDGIKGNLKIAGQQLRAFGRKLACQSYLFCCAICIVIFLILGVIGVGVAIFVPWNKIPGISKSDQYQNTPALFVILNLLLVYLIF